MKPKLPPDVLARCRSLRHNATQPEVLLWCFLRNRALNGYKFRRQYPCQGYILDFYCLELKLAIELDGSGHLDTEEYDEQRTKELEGVGIQVLRFWNDDVLLRTEEVVGLIWEVSEERKGRD